MHHILLNPCPVAWDYLLAFLVSNFASLDTRIPLRVALVAINVLRRQNTSLGNSTSHSSHGIS